MGLPGLEFLLSFNPPLINTRIIRGILAVSSSVHVGPELPQGTRLKQVVWTDSHRWLFLQLN